MRQGVQHLAMYWEARSEINYSPEKMWESGMWCVPRFVGRLASPPRIIYAVSSARRQTFLLQPDPSSPAFAVLADKLIRCIYAMCASAPTASAISWHELSLLHADKPTHTRSCAVSQRVKDHQNRGSLFRPRRVYPRSTRASSHSCAVTIEYICTLGDRAVECLLELLPAQHLGRQSYSPLQTNLISALRALIHWHDQAAASEVRSAFWGSTSFRRLQFSIPRGRGATSVKQQMSLDCKRVLSTE
ncbi:hypothetical protein GGX14DRAFT_393980 [Mycena pura]|uniref:Uncharacterized protein n=1 Tax=Mycena pura TaxID=153505 RepID=A0AAD6YCJ1_9AGAR|nr:hypothetical protein GGX14DRAFT_393980 [Mycena pura]